MSAFDFVQALKTSNTLGASWRLPPPAVKPQDPKPKSEVLEDENHAEESVFYPDNRQKVQPSDFADGGKYRSIVKISMRYEGMSADDDRWAIGTGYLVAPDVLITAGHGLGRLTHMRCFIGYSGKDSAGDSSVQFRAATKVVTTAKYIIDGDRRRDVAFVKVDQPFEGNLNLFKYEDTPLKATAVLGIVGYPGDKEMNGERGAQMYGLVDQVTYDLATSQNKMLEYRISTAGGQSGAPVLKFKLRSAQIVPDVVIGTHCYGGSGKNSASVIRGQYGNDYKTLMDGLQKNGSLYITDISKGLPGVKPGPDPSPEPVAEGFLDILKAIGRVVTPITQQGLSFASPFLGPLGGAMSAIGGIALGALSKVCEEFALDEDKTPSYKLQDGIAHRAILSEAALLAVLRMERSPANKRIMDSMTAKYHGSGFDADKANKLDAKLVPLMSQAGLHLAINENLITSKKQATGMQKIKPHGPELIIPSADTQVEEFLDAAAQAEAKTWRTVGNEDKSEAEFFNDLTQFLAAGSQAPKPALIFSNRADLTTGQKQLDDYLSRKPEKPETDLPVRPNPTDKSRPITDAKTAGLLAHRAVLAECALQAVLEADNGDLQESVILDDTGSAEPESFFDGLLKTVQMMGSAVVKVAHKVLDVAVKSHARAESSEAAVKVNGAGANEFVNGYEPNPDAPIFVPGHLAP
ncbi:hypothetical protein N0V85_008531 [Neurospora sp. IMI 360204]|nr:hypothetical protein N0V85_008531 [Neurospora sp. IMI 360204]